MLPKLFLEVEEMFKNNINANLENYMYNQEQAVQNRRSNAVNQGLNSQNFAYERPESNWLDSALEGAAGEGGKYIFNKFAKGGA